jgi:hypothetical protein
MAVVEVAGMAEVIADNKLRTFCAGVGVDVVLLHCFQGMGVSRLTVSQELDGDVMLR